MIRSTLLAAALLMGGASSLLAKGYKGDYTLSFFSDPGSLTGAVFCLDFVQTSDENGFINSGTFSDTGGVGLSGFFMVDGTTFHLILTNSPYGDVVDLIGKFPAGSYADFVSAGGVDGVGTYKLVKGCTASSRRPGVAHHMVTQ